MNARSTFLAAAGVFIALSAAAREHVALIGTYTNGASRGIYALRLDAETGALTPPELVAELADPEFLALHPQASVLYALTQVPDAAGRRQGAVTAFAWEANPLALRALGTVTGGRDSFCHLAVDTTGRLLLAASYGGGAVAAFPLTAEGRVGEPVQWVEHAGPPGPHAPRQEAPHPHSVTLSPDNQYAWVADLGLDRVFVYRLQLGEGRIEPHEPPFLSTAPGAGPRHTAFSPDGQTFYVLNELNNTVLAARYDPSRGEMRAFATAPTLPERFAGQNTTSEIRVHPNGRFVYAANRGHDSLAVLARDPETGALTRTAVVPCGGRRPRNFNLTPDGAWLLCAHQDSDTVAVFRVDPATGGLEQVGAPVSVPSPVCVLFVEERQE